MEYVPRFAFPSWPVRPCYLIDLEPGEFPNAVHPRSGRVEVAILTTPGFHAKNIVRSSIRFGTGEMKARARGTQLVDIDRDDDRDLLARFRTRATGVVCSSTAARLRARLQDGTKVIGRDSVAPAGC